MELEKEITKAIERPFQDKKKLLIGMLLTMPIPILSFITSPIINGYNLQCMKNTVRNKYNLPTFENLGTLWIRGFLIKLILFLYFLPALIMFFLFLLVLALRKEVSFMTPFLGLFIIYGIFLIYVWPCIEIQYACTEKFKEAFAWKLILKKIVSLTYARVWLITSLIIFIMIGILLGMVIALKGFEENELLLQLSSIILLGIFGFPMRIMVITLFARAYRETK